MADLLSYALTTLSDVKETLGINNSSQDNLIKRKINHATLAIESYCNLAYDHHFKSTVYTDEQYDGSGSDQMFLRMSPVTTFTSFSIRTTTQNDDSWDVIDSQLYFVDMPSGVIDLLFSQSLQWNKFKVTYEAGYATIPFDLSEACVTLASYFVQNAVSGTGVKRKREGQREVEYFAAGSSSKSLMEDLGLDDMLQKYVRYAIIGDK